MVTGLMAQEEEESWRRLDLQGEGETWVRTGDTDVEFALGIEGLREHVVVLGRAGSITEISPSLKPRRGTRFASMPCWAWVLTAELQWRLSDLAQACEAVGTSCWGGEHFETSEEITGRVFELELMGTRLRTETEVVLPLVAADPDAQKALVVAASLGGQGPCELPTDHDAVRVLVRALLDEAGKVMPWR